MDEYLFKALTNPNGLSGHTYADGTPLTNAEYYQKINTRSGQS